MAGINDNTDHYQGAILEDMNDKLTAILEGQASMVTVPAKLDNLQASVDELTSDMKAVKATIKDQSQGLKEHGVYCSFRGSFLRAGQLGA